MIATLILISQISGVTLAAILNTAWESIAVAAIIWCALRLTPRVNAATRHAAWWAVLAIIVLIPFAPRVSRHETAANIGTPTITQSQPSSAHPPTTIVGSPLSLSPLPVNSRTSGAATPSRIVLPFEFRPGIWPSAIFVIWLLVSVLLLARVALSYFHLRRVRARSIPVTGAALTKFTRCVTRMRLKTIPRLLVSDELFSPLAAGFLHPVVIVPQPLLNEMSESELENVLLHELAHFARGDNWTNLLARLVSPVLALHPVAALALSKIEREREIACDDWAVAFSGSARNYAATLARLFEVCGARRRELLATGMAHRSSRLGERIEILLVPKRDFVPRTSFARLSLCSAIALVIVAAGVRMPNWIALAQDSPAVVATAARLEAPQIDVQPVRPTLPIQAVHAAAPTISPAASIPSATPTQSTAGTTTYNQHRPFGLSGEGWTQEWVLNRSSSSSSGTIRFRFGYRRGSSEMVTETDMPLTQFRGFSLAMLDHDGPVKFEFVRDAGELMCEGTVSNGRASGTFTLNPNRQFASALVKMGFAAPSDDEMASLVMSDVTLEFARAVKDTGLALAAGELADLKSHGVTAHYVRQARHSDLTKSLTAGDFCELRTHGVEPDYLKQILAVDPKLSANDISELRTHGVEPGYLKGIKASGVSLSMEEISSLRTHGAEPDYFRDIHQINSKLSIDEINRLRTHGVEPDFYKGMQAVDGKLSIEEISQLRTHGVEPSYLQGIEAVDRKLPIDQICDLRTHGVEPVYYRDIRAVDPAISISAITNLRTHGVEADYLKEIKLADSHLSMNDITELRTHGVPPSFVSEAKAMGYQFTPSELSNLWNHGVNQAYLHNLQSMGIKNLSADQIMRLRDGR